MRHRDLLALPGRLRYYLLLSFLAFLFTSTIAFTKFRRINLERKASNIGYDNSNSVEYHLNRISHPKASKSIVKDSISFFLQNLEVASPYLEELLWFKILEVAIKYKLEEVIDLYSEMAHRRICINSVHMTGILTIG